MQKSIKAIIIVQIINILFCIPAFCAPEVKGQPEVLWLTPMADNNIDNTAKNRCRIIKILKPGEDKPVETRANTNQLIGRYSTDLYFQATKTLFEIDKEKVKEGKQLNDEKRILEQEVLERMANIADRLNIIVSLEARTSALNSLYEISKLENGVYSSYHYDQETQDCSIDLGR